MFGLTKREQRWKAEQQAAEALAGLAASMVRSVADVRVAEAHTDAAELTRLRAELETLRAKVKELSLQALSDSGQAIESLADAERYRWLRSQHWATAQLAVVRNPKEAVKLGHDLPSGERLDAAIDAARAVDAVRGEK